MKKLISVTLALVMAMALMIPAFATTQTMTGTGVTAAPTIKLTMPKSVNIALNPYRMAYTNTKIGLNTATSETFISPVVEIKNDSDVALEMSVKGNAVKAGGIKVLTTAPTDGVEEGTITTTAPGDKNVMISVNILPNQDKALADDSDADPLDLGTTGVSTAVLSDKAADLKFGTDEDSPTTIDLDAAFDEDGKAASNYIRINFSGECNTNPKEAYTASDTLGVSLTFTFKPVAAAAAAAAEEGEGG